MSTSTAPAPIPSVPVSVASLVPAGVETKAFLASLAPAGESLSVRAAVARSLAAAVAQSLSVFAVPAGVVPGAPASSPVWAVPSATVAGRAHLVWVAESGRLACSCPAHLSPRVVCCSHTAAVRLVLLAASGRLVGGCGASAPEAGLRGRPSEASRRREGATAPASPQPAPDPEPEPPAPDSESAAPVPLCGFCGGAEISACSAFMCPYRRAGVIPAEECPGSAGAGPDPEPEPEPPSPPPAASAGPVCPCCGGAADPRELEELGECLSCCAGRAGVELARCACGALASGEMRDGPVCSTCAREIRERWLFAQMELRESAERGAAAARAESQRRKSERTRSQPTAHDLGTARGYIYRRTSSGDVTRAPVESLNNSRFYCTWSAWLERGHEAAGAAINDAGEIVEAASVEE